MAPPSCGAMPPKMLPNSPCGASCGCAANALKISGPTCFAISCASWPKSTPCGANCGTAPYGATDGGCACTCGCAVSKLKTIGPTCFATSCASCVRSKPCGVTPPLGYPVPELAIAILLQKPFGYEMKANAGLI